MEKFLCFLFVFCLSGKVFSQPSCGVGFTPKTLDAAGYIALVDTVDSNYDFTQLFFNFKWASLKGIPMDTAYNDPFMNGWIVPQIHSHGIKLLACIDFTEGQNRKKLNIDTSYHGTDTSFQQAPLKQAYIDETFYIVKKYHPEYVALAVEIDDYLNAHSLAERTALLSAIDIVQDSIKNFDPAIKTFVYFQFENVKVHGLWNIIKPFADSSDYYGFSTYPSVLGIYGSNLPLNYYDTIQTLWGSSKPIVFPEFGEPTDTTYILPVASQQNQRNFVDRFFYSISDLNVGLINWVYLHDVKAVFQINGWPLSLSKYFGSMGLRDDTSGTAKLAFPYFNCNLLSVNDNSERKFQIKVFPNPSHGSLYLESTDIKERLIIDIYDVMGVLKKKIFLNIGETTINIEDLPDGIYFLEFSDENNSFRKTARFIQVND